MDGTDSTKSTTFSESEKVLLFVVLFPYKKYYFSPQRLYGISTTPCYTFTPSFSEILLKVLLLQDQRTGSCQSRLSDPFCPGHVGGPAPCTLIKLADVPELNYYAKDRKGEVS